MKLNSFLFLILLLFITCERNPIAIFHGIVDSCKSNKNKQLVNDLSQDLGVYVECVEVLGGYWDSVLKPLSKQFDAACAAINANEHFQGKFDIIGFSQGTVISRYIIEKCEMKGQVEKFLSFNGPQMGIGSIPKLTCGTFCNWLIGLSAPVFYKMRDKVGPAAYFRYRYNQEYYVENNILLKMLNNENEEKDPEVYKRFSSLEKVMLVKNKKDSVITPVESSWFEFYDFEGNEIVPLRESNFYLEDWIGFKKLDEEGKLIFEEFEGEHVIYSDEEYKTKMVPFFES